jgi:hypothetical protein
VSGGQYDQRITTYFGDAVMRAGFMPLPHLLMRHYHDLGLQAEHAMFAMQLMEVTWDLQRPPNTMKKLAERMGVSIRTAQRYSEHLVDQGLLVVYEQFEAGAQVENGYDLRPLFARLAQFAPEPAPGGSPRERRVRQSARDDQRPSPATATGAQGSAIAALHPPVAGDTLPGDSGDVPPGVMADIPPSDSIDTPRAVTAVMPSAPVLTGLNKESKKPSKKHQKKQAGSGGVSPAQGRMFTLEEQTQPSPQSLRSGQPLTEHDIMQNRSLLDQLGIHAPIAAAITSTIAPAELWSLATYARGARLGAGWIAKQCFDFATRQPRPHTLATRYDRAGVALATLPMPLAQAVLDQVDSCCPDTYDLLGHDARLVDDAARDVAETVWEVMSELRGGRAVPPERTSAPGASPRASYEQLWQKIVGHMAAHLSPVDVATWLAPSRLLEVDADRVVIGTPNVFVRDIIAASMLPPLATAFQQELGRTLAVELAIEQSR